MDEPRNDRVRNRPIVQRKTYPRTRHEELLRQMEQDIEQGNEESFRRNLQSCASIGNQEQREALDGRSLLHIAARAGRTNFVQMLLNAATDPNAKDSFGLTPLFDALHGESDPVLKITHQLLEAGADPNAQNSTGKTALHVVAADSDSPVAPLIISDMIQHGGNVNMKDSDQFMPLHYAVQRLAADNVEQLISCGADANARAPFSRTPLHLAILASRHSRGKTWKKIISMLLEGRADPNAKDNDGVIPLHHLHDDDISVAENLLEFGADPNAKDNEGRTPLHGAVAHRDFSLVDQLLTFGADPTAVDSKGVTPEFTALFLGPNRMVRLFDKPRVFKKPTKGLRTSTRQTRPSEPPAGLKEVCEYFTGSIRYFGPQGPAYQNRRVSVLDMLYGDALSKHVEEFTGDLRWFHLPATNKFWVEQLVEAICSIDGKPLDKAESEVVWEKKTEKDCHKIKQFIHKTFNETGQERRFRQPGFIRSTYLRDETDASSRQHASEVASLVLPMIDVDYCADKRKQLEERHKASVVHTKPSKDSKKATLKYESTHIQMMAKLRDCYGHLGLHFPLSLDESGYELQEVDLDRRNAGQVLTRYLKRLQDSDSRMAAAGPERCKRGSAPPPITTGRKKETMQPELPGRRTSLQNWLDVAASPWPQVASGDLGTETESIRCQMLLVPQLWLWKIDNRTIITAFPERWDRKHSRSVLDTIQSDLPSTDKIEDAVKDIIDVCINYIEDQFFVGKGLGMTCIDVFATSITSVAERVTHCYAEFEKSIGYSFKTIKTQIRQEIRVLEEIDDILDEIGMIKRVLHDQELVMKKVLRWRHQRTTSRGANVVQGTDHLHQPLKHFKRLEEDANRVRSSLITLLDIRQREATIDEALENSRQSKALFVFTLITILFAPLSFCEQLLAIPILELEARLPARWVAKVSALTMLATVLFAGALLYLYPKIFSASLSSLGDPISSTPNSNNSKAQEVPPKGGRFNYVWRFRPKRQTKRAKPDDPELGNWQALT